MELKTRFEISVGTFLTTQMAIMTRLVYAAGDQELKLP